MAFAAIKRMLKGPDIVSVDRVGDTTKYVARTSGITDKGVRIRTKISKIFDLPPKIPRDIRVERLEEGLIFKTYKVEYEVPIRRGKIRNIKEKIKTKLRRR